MNYNKDTCTLEVINWEKYHFDKKYKALQWIRITTYIFEDEVWARLPPFSMLFWLYLLTVCGRLNSARASFQVRLASFATRLNPVSIRRIIDGLEEYQLVKIIERSWSVKTLTVKHALQNKTVHNRTEHYKNMSSGDDASPLKLIDLWNNDADAKLPRVQSVSPKRKKRAILAWKNKPDESFWRSVITTCNKTEFCMGKNNRGWRANFDWIIQDGVADKILEGVYGGAKTLADNFFDFLPTESEDKS